MKIAFFTEINRGCGIKIVQRDHPNLRTDLAWACALNAEIVSIWDAYDRAISGEKLAYDLGIFIVPKKTTSGFLDASKTASALVKIKSLMQEGNHQYYQDYDIGTQIQYLNFLNEVDFLLCHNEYDKRYYEGLLPGKKVFVFQSLMIEDSIPKTLIEPEHRKGVMIGGNWCSWYSGQDSYFIAKEFEDMIYAPSMGRKQPDEELIDDIIYSPYRNWSQWMVDLSTRRYGVHLMRTWAAGTFSLNCAYIGIPCIGYNQLDTQRICFPELSVELGDLVSARKKAKHLKENQEFYRHCSEYAKKAYYDNFREEIFIQNFEEIMQCMITMPQ